MTYSEMTRFAGSRSARWGRIVGRCRACGKEVRLRTCREYEADKFQHIKDGGLVDADQPATLLPAASPPEGA